MQIVGRGTTQLLYKLYWRLETPKAALQVSALLPQQLAASRPFSGGEITALESISR